MSRRASWWGALFLCASGAAALALQVAWMREFRLIFGHSTAANSAVLAIFMGGLGAGGFVLGRRAEGVSSPLRLYALLEAGVAVSAALTPLLLPAARGVYVAAGGSAALGEGGATLLRLGLSVLVLGVPTFLMGGTLPAVARAVTSGEDRSRRGLSLLYGANTLGAVAGALAATFLLIEAVGNRWTLWAACGLLCVVAAAAWALAPGIEVAGSPDLTPPSRKPKKPGAVRSESAAAPGFLYAAAAWVGFVFFLMELVWYRMLTPLMGGSVYTFGVILAVALAGIGAGGLLYRIRGAGAVPTLQGFAFTCALEAACLAAPYALGDRLAVLAARWWRPAVEDFAGLIGGWLALGCIVILPAALVAGYQFPLLIGLLGRGRASVARHTGWAYGWNTLGAILGALAGGFGFLPWLTAPGAWRAAVVLLLVLSALALLGVPRVWSRLGVALPPLAAGVLAVVAVMQTGPTAAWRHSAVGAGRAQLAGFHPNQVRDWIHGMRRTVIWEREGIESSVALRVASRDGLAVVINGKSDGSARGDIGTMLLPGVLPAVLHPAPKRALVVGLATGVTAGWLAGVPGMERVDVVELEPQTRHAAGVCRQANRDLLDRPNVRLIFADAREYLLTTQETYDLIVSQPSNPYRAGVASLFTLDFYRTCARRLNDRGIFAQWLQAYEAGRPALESVYKTLTSAFADVETWQTQAYDLLFLARDAAPRYDAATLRRRMEAPIFREAFLRARRVEGIEGLLAHFVAGPEFARRLAARSDDVNTDDRMGLEYAFARTAGAPSEDHITAFRIEARRHGEDRLRVAAGSFDSEQVASARATATLFEGLPLPADPELSRIAPLVEARRLALEGRFAQAAAAWPRRRRSAVPLDPLERLLLAETQVRTRDPSAEASVERIAADHPTEAAALDAWRLAEAGDLPGAVARLEDAFRLYRQRPWALGPVMRRALDLAYALSRRDPRAGERLFRALEPHFSLYVLQAPRQNSLIALSETSGFGRLCRDALAQLEPYVPWQRGLLEYRVRCYEATGDPRAASARRDLEAYMAAEDLP